MSLSMALVLFNACSPEDTAVSGIALDETSVSFGVGDTLALKATLAPKEQPEPSYGVPPMNRSQR